MRCLASNTACPGYFQETKFLDEGVGLRRKFNYDEAYYSSTSRKKPKELVTSSDKGYEHDLDALPPLTFQSPGDSEPAFNQRSSHDESEIANTSPFAASDSHTETEPAEENDILESNNFRDQNVVLDAYPDSNGSSSLKQRPTYGTDSSLSNSMFSVFQNSTNRLSTLSLPSGPVLLENEEESEFEILFLIRHFTEVVGSWSVKSHDEIWGVLGPQLIAPGWTCTILESILQPKFLSGLSRVLSFAIQQLQLQQSNWEESKAISPFLAVYAKGKHLQKPTRTVIERTGFTLPQSITTKLLNFLERGL
jgi:hypothetical protein